MADFEGFLEVCACLFVPFLLVSEVVTSLLPLDIVATLLPLALLDISRTDVSQGRTFNYLYLLVTGLFYIFPLLVQLFHEDFLQAYAIDSKISSGIAFGIRSKTLFLFNGLDSDRLISRLQIVLGIPEQGTHELF